MNFIKCWFNGHRYSKPRVKIIHRFPFIKVHKHVACKNCGKTRALSPDEQFQAHFYAVGFIQPKNKEQR